MFLAILLAVRAQRLSQEEVEEAADPWMGPKAMLAEGREMVAMGKSLIDEGQAEAGEKMISEGQRRIQNAYNLLPDELEE